jgi:cyclopropane fatty-acyl-phospholipid synthase-like methyltransferase
MTRRHESLAPDYFESLYQADPDPWRFATSPYEQEKYAASLAALPPRRFATALELGCSIGIFTRALSARCDHLLALDVSLSALAQARHTCAGLPVTLENRRIPAEWPAGSFDLIVLSEILYYLAAEDVRRAAALAVASLNRPGIILMVHYLGETDYPLTGDDAAHIFATASGLRATFTTRSPLYRIDMLENDP